MYPKHLNPFNFSLLKVINLCFQNFTAKFLQQRFIFKSDFATPFFLRKRSAIYLTSTLSEKPSAVFSKRSLIAEYGENEANTICHTRSFYGFFIQSNKSLSYSKMSKYFNAKTSFMIQQTK